MTIAVVDYGIGNLGSVMKAFRHLVRVRRAGGGRPGRNRLRCALPRHRRARQRPGRAVPSREEPGRGPAPDGELRARVRAFPRREDGMIVMPAIDVRGGKVVRLKQGQLQEETVYGSDPGAVARKWANEGTRRLQVVDLDAAVSGRPQSDAIAAVIDAVDIPVEVGGGLRVLEIAMRYRDRGADRVVFGTAAIADPGVVQEAARLWPQSVAVALDARNGKVAVAGWKEITRVDAVELARRVKGWGVSRVQYTDVMRDGTLTGPNLPGVEAMGAGSAKDKP